MLQKTKGIVLHTLKYNDTSIIVDIYTELSGRASFLVAVPRSRKAAVKSVLFQPLSFIEFEADYRPNGLQTECDSLSGERGEILLSFFFHSL